VCWLQKQRRWNGLVKSILDGDADMAISALQITPDRSDVIDFSVPFLETGISILVAVRDGVISPMAFLGTWIIISFPANGSVPVLGDGMSVNSTALYMLRISNWLLLSGGNAESSSILYLPLRQVLPYGVVCPSVTLVTRAFCHRWDKISFDKGTLHVLDRSCGLLRVGDISELEPPDSIMAKSLPIVKWLVGYCEQPVEAQQQPI